MGSCGTLRWVVTEPRRTIILSLENAKARIHPSPEVGEPPAGDRDRRRRLGRSPPGLPPEPPVLGRGGSGRRRAARLPAARGGPRGRHLRRGCGPPHGRGRLPPRGLRPPPAPKPPPPPPPPNPLRPGAARGAPPLREAGARDL